MHNEEMKITATGTGTVGAQLRCAIGRDESLRESPSIAGLLRQRGAAVVLAAFFFAPQAALAQNECDPLDPPSADGATADTYTCDADNYPGGITYTSDGDLTLEVPASSDNFEVNDEGIDVTAGNDADNLFWDSSLYTSGFRGPAIIGTAGEVLDYRSVDGDIDILIGGEITAIEDATHAVRAEATGAGNLSIAVEDEINGGVRIGFNNFPGTGNGIEALTAAGDIAIEARDVNAGVGGQFGVRAVSSGGGDIQMSGGRIVFNGNVFFRTMRLNTGDDAIYGIRASSAGGNIDIINAQIAMGASATHGIRVDSAGGDIDISARVTMGAAGTHGILAESGGGNIDVSTFNIPMGPAATHAILADSAGGDIVMSASGITTGAAATHAVLADAGAGNITLEAGDIAFSGDAVAIETRSDGLTTINVDSQILRDITSSATNDIAIRGSGNRAVVNLEGPPPTNFPDENFFQAPGIRGAVDFSGLSGGADVNVRAGNMWALGTSKFRSGAIANDEPATPSRFSDGDDIVTIAAGGFLTTPLVGGNFDESLTPTAAEDLVIVRFGGGNDVVDNAGGLLLGPNSATGFLGPSLYEAELRFEGLDEFNNTGTIHLGAAVDRHGFSDPAEGRFLRPGTTDGHPDDLLAMPGAVFHGGEGSRILMDADLSKVGQPACDAALRDADGNLPVSDCIDIAGAGAAATGRTLIKVNDLDFFDRGAFIPDGNVIVDLAGSDPADTDPEAFALDPESDHFNPDSGGIMDKGLFFYALAYDPATQQFKLFGLPGSTGQQFPLLAHASNDLWRTATGAWFERRADQRDVELAAGLRRGAWARGGYGDADRDVITPIVAGGETFEFDNSYNQEDQTITLGRDFIFRDEGDSSWVIGGMIGYGRSQLEYEEENSANLEGMYLGMYGSFVTGAFYLDAAINASKLDIHNDVPPVNLTPEGTVLSTEAHSLGARLEAGWRWRYGFLAVEPLAGVTYVQTSMDDVEIPARDPVFFGAEVGYEDTVSNRVSGGVRLSADGVVSGPVSIPFTDARVPMPVIDFGLTARGIEELDGEGEAGIVNSGPIEAPVTDTYDGTYSRVDGDITFSNAARTAVGYLQVNGTFGDDYDSVGGSLGFRYQW